MLLGLGRGAATARSQSALAHIAARLVHARSLRSPLCRENRTRPFADRLLRSTWHLQAGSNSAADLLPLPAWPDARHTISELRRQSEGIGGIGGFASGEILLSTVYLVRHGQAGTRDAYDSLSQLGERQARLLGEHFISQGIRFASAYAGALTRQQQTAEQIRTAYADAGVGFPTVRVDSGWDEFDLGRVYREIAPLLAAEDPEFLHEYDEMREQVRVSQGAHGARIHRRWMPCDTKVVEAWLSGRYQYSGETWDQFRERVAACRLKMERQENEARQQNDARQE